MESFELQPENTNECSIFRNIRAALEDQAGVNPVGPGPHSGQEDGAGAGHRHTR